DRGERERARAIVMTREKRAHEGVAEASREAVLAGAEVAIVLVQRQCEAMLQREADDPLRHRIAIAALVAKAALAPLSRDIPPWADAGARAGIEEGLDAEQIARVFGRTIGAGLCSKVLSEPYGTIHRLCGEWNRTGECQQVDSHGKQLEHAI